MRVFLVVLVLLLLLPQAVMAEQFTGQRPGDAKLSSEIASAQRAWAGLGITGCPNGITGWFASDLLGARGRGGGCTIYIDPKYTRVWVSRPWISFVECTIVEHEVGHALGLQHSDSGRFPIMAENVSASQYTGRCEVLRPDYRRSFRACQNRKASIKLVLKNNCSVSRSKI